MPENRASCTPLLGYGSGGGGGSVGTLTVTGGTGGSGAGGGRGGSAGVVTDTGGTTGGSAGVVRATAGEGVAVVAISTDGADSVVAPGCGGAVPEVVAAVGRVLGPAPAARRAYRNCGVAAACFARRVALAAAWSRADATEFAACCGRVAAFKALTASTVL